MRKIRNIIILLIILLTICLSLLACYIVLKGENNNEDNYNVNEPIVKNPEFWNIQIVKNANDFYTVASCIDKYLNFWYMQDKEDVYNILEENYKKENLITKDNVFEKIGTLSEMLTFRPQKMYYINLEQSVQKYYAYGTVRSDFMEQRGEESDYYIEVILNFNNGTFSIRPSTREEFPDNL